MDEFIRAQTRYLAQAKRNARAKGYADITDYLGEKTQLMEGGQTPAILEPPPPEPTNKDATLPISDALVTIIIREPFGEFTNNFVIPSIGEIFTADRRNENGYFQAFREAILYKFYGVLPR